MLIGTKLKHNSLINNLFGNHNSYPTLISNYAPTTLCFLMLSKYTFTTLGISHSLLSAFTLILNSLNTLSILYDNNSLNYYFFTIFPILTNFMTSLTLTSSTLLFFNSILLYFTLSFKLILISILFPSSLNRNITLFSFLPFLPLYTFVGGPCPPLNYPPRENSFLCFCENRKIDLLFSFVVRST